MSTATTTSLPKAVTLRHRDASRPVPAGAAGDVRAGWHTAGALRGGGGGGGAELEDDDDLSAAGGVAPRPSSDGAAFGAARAGDGTEDAACASVSRFTPLQFLAG